MPNSKVALEVLKKFGPLATTSVNISNNPPINNLEEIIEYFKDKIDYIIEDKEDVSKISSTIVDVSKDKVVILRQGDIKL
jgi:L-threonylcarbamoyladenylate synthase